MRAERRTRACPEAAGPHQQVSPDRAEAAGPHQQMSPDRAEAAGPHQQVSEC